jgi:stalled ribosome alternative rescue factor ArfA|tara:strand:+ start:1596 stop:1712 length:117 start_codon:yes stop_codon:yes gene_type:complete
MAKSNNKNCMVAVLYTKQYAPKKVKAKKGKGSFKRKKK